MTLRWLYDDLVNWIEDGCDDNIAKEVFSLNIACQDLKALPMEIFKLTNLKMFFCCNNNLTFIPEEISNIVKLKFYWILYYVLIGSQTYKRIF